MRVAQELHDGIIQVLVSAKFFETAQVQVDQRTASIHSDNAVLYACGRRQSYGPQPGT